MIIEIDDNVQFKLCFYNSFFEYHKLDGPALITDDRKEYYIHGELHRENGPALEFANGYKEWWINGKRLSLEKESILNQWWDNKNGI